MVNPLWLKQEKDKMQLDKKIQIITGWVGIIATILSFLISTGQVTEIFKIIDLTNTVSQIVRCSCFSDGSISNVFNWKSS